MKKYIFLLALLAVQALAVPQIYADGISGDYIYKDREDEAKITIKEAGNGVFTIQTEYANPSSLRTCEYEGECRVSNNRLVCFNSDDIDYAKDLGIDPSEKRVEFSLQNNGIKLEFFKTSYCNTGIPDGIYKKVSDKKPVPSAKSSSNCFGPVVFGMQLGMSHAEIDAALSQYAKKHNLIFDKKRGTLWSNDNTQKYFEPCFLSWNGVDMIIIGKIAFNVDNPLDKEFLQKFMQNYNIPQLSPEYVNGNLVYKYRDENEGFSVDISQQCVILSRIPKKQKRSTGGATFE